jgi:hypothetical protein
VPSLWRRRRQNDFSAGDTSPETQRRQLLCQFGLPFDRKRRRRPCQKFPLTLTAYPGRGNASLPPPRPPIQCTRQACQGISVCEIDPRTRDGIASSVLVRMERAAAAGSVRGHDSERCRRRAASGPEARHAGDAAGLLQGWPHLKVTNLSCRPIFRRTRADAGRCGHLCE